ncbi:MAG: hypothetical protein ACRDXX_22540 [Stackebrandtia sp.]
MSYPPPTRPQRQSRQLIAMLVVAVAVLLAAVVTAVVLKVGGGSSSGQNGGSSSEETGADSDAGAQGAAPDSAEQAAERYLELAVADQDADAAADLQCDDYSGLTPDELYSMVTGYGLTTNDPDEIAVPSEIDVNVTDTSADGKTSQVQASVEAVDDEDVVLTYIFTLTVEDVGGGWAVCDAEREDA